MLMTKTSHLYYLFLCIALIGLAILPLSASAFGVGLVPTSITIMNAARDGEYNYSVSAVNIDSNPVRINLSTEGYAGPWVTVYTESDDIHPVQNLTLEGHQSVPLRLYVKIPHEVANGNYNMSIVIETAPTEIEMGENSSVVRASFVAKSSVDIDISGKEVLQGKVEYISAGDTEIGYPVYFETLFVNTGNVIAAPEMQITVENNLTQVDSFSYKSPGINPNVREVVRIPWNTTGMEEGDYNATVSVFLGTEKLTVRNVSFEILPKGTFTRQGNMTQLKYTGDAKPNELLKITGVFENTGVIVTSAKLIGEVTMGDKLIDTFTSEEIQVPPFGTEDLVSYLRLSDPGQYTVKAYVLYEGKKTNTSELSINIAEPAAVTTPSADPPMIGLSILGFIIAGLFLIMHRK
jgi:hypothetical protein